MKKITGILTLTLTLFGCKVTTTPVNKGDDVQVEKGGSILYAKKYFDTPQSPITHGLDGLWRQAQSSTDSGYDRREAFIFKGARSMLLAVECQKRGFIVYSMVRVPIQRVRNKITITEARAYEASEKDEKFDIKLSCPAIIKKGSLYYSIKEGGEILCLSAAPDCRGKKSEFIKIRDDI